jgi:hypothetical protein
MTTVATPAARRPQSNEFSLGPVGADAVASVRIRHTPFGFNPVSM